MDLLGVVQTPRPVTVRMRSGHHYPVRGPLCGRTGSAHSMCHRATAAGGRRTPTVTETTVRPTPTTRPSGQGRPQLSHAESGQPVEGVGADTPAPQDGHGLGFDVDERRQPRTDGPTVTGLDLGGGTVITAIPHSNARPSGKPFALSHNRVCPA